MARESHQTHARCSRKMYFQSDYPGAQGGPDPGACSHCGLAQPARLGKTGRRTRQGMRTRAAAAAAAHQTEDDDAPEEVSLASGRETAQLQRQEESRAAKEKKRAAKERRRKAAEPSGEHAVVSAGKLHKSRCLIFLLCFVQQQPRAVLV